MWCWERGAREKAEIEYRKFQAKTPSPVEKEHLESIKALEITARKANRTIESQTKQEAKKKKTKIWSVKILSCLSNNQEIYNILILNTFKGNFCSFYGRIAVIVHNS